MPTARAPWTPRRVMPPVANEMDCDIAPRLDGSYPDIAAPRSLRARVINAAYWIGGTVGVIGLFAGCDRASALFQ